MVEICRERRQQLFIISCKEYIYVNSMVHAADWGRAARNQAPISVHQIERHLRIAIEKQNTPTSGRTVRARMNDRGQVVAMRRTRTRAHVVAEGQQRAYPIPWKLKLSGGAVAAEAP